MKFRFRHLPGYIGFLADLHRYRKIEGAERISLRDLYPCIGEKTATTSYDSHYFYQDTWAFRKIREESPPEHVDVGSRIDFVGFLAAITPGAGHLSPALRLARVRIRINGSL